MNAVVIIIISLHAFCFSLGFSRHFHYSSVFIAYLNVVSHLGIVYIFLSLSRAYLNVTVFVAFCVFMLYVM